jgi:drug/metabolite transporter (DMT)-like permease
VNLGQVLGCLLVAVALAAGQILFKAAAMAMPKIRGLGDIAVAAQLPVLWLAFIVYGSATLFWIYMLQTVPLSRAYLFAALAFLIVPVCGILFFGERASLGLLIGGVLILAGLLVIAQS